MKKMMMASLVSMMTLIPNLSFAIGYSELEVEGLVAVNVILDSGVQRCLRSLQSGTAQLQIDEMANVMNAEGNRYFLSGSTVSVEGFTVGSWEIVATQKPVEVEGQASLFVCEITKNQE